MKKRVLAWCLALCLVVGLLPTAALAVTEEDCFDGCEHKAAIGTTHYDTLDEALTAAKSKSGDVTVDLLTDMTLDEWTKFDLAGKTFASLTVNGNSKTITGLSAPLFTYVNYPLTIKNLNVANPDIDEEGHDEGTGVLVDWHNSGLLTIQNCHVSGENTTYGIFDGNYVGGLVGYSVASAKIENSSVKKLSLTSYGTVGSLVGLTNGNITIANCEIGGNIIETIDDKKQKIGAVIGTVTGSTNNYISVDETAKSDGKCQGEPATLNVIGRLHRNVSYTGGSYFSDPCVASEVGSGAVFAGGNKVDTTAGKWTFADVATVQVGDEAPVTYRSLELALKEASAGATVTLLEDLDLNGWTSVKPAANLTFDGGEHKITGLTAPLFHPVEASLVINNVTVEDPAVVAPVDEVNNFTAAGALIGIAQLFGDATISINNCHVLGDSLTDSFKSSAWAGGLVGYHNGSGSVSITNSSVKDIIIKSTAGDGTQTGGLIGLAARLTVTNCVVGNNKFYVKAGNAAYTGSVAGMTYGNDTSRIDAIEESRSYIYEDNGREGTALAVGNSTYATVVFVDGEYFEDPKKVSLVYAPENKDYSDQRDTLVKVKDGYVIAQNYEEMYSLGKVLNSGVTVVGPVETLEQIGTDATTIPAGVTINMDGVPYKVEGEVVTVENGKINVPANSSLKVGDGVVISGPAAVGSEGYLVITASSNTLEGGGDVVLTVVAGSDTDNEVSVECSPAGVTLVKNENGTWTATLPNQDQKYTFTARYVVDDGQSVTSASCVVAVSAYYYYYPDPVVPGTPSAPGTPTVKPVDPDKPLTHPFTDVPDGQWYSESVAYVYTNGIMNGVNAEGTIFDRYGTTSRAMLMTILARMSGVDTTVGATWDEIGMLWAKANGISDGTNGARAISRQELATMLWRYAGCPEVYESELAALGRFGDYANVGTWAERAMAWCVSKGIINGINGELAPELGADRATVATMLMRFCESMET